jgi:hypothetical protein
LFIAARTKDIFNVEVEILPGLYTTIHNKQRKGYLMKIAFKTDGGFAYLPALSRPVVIDTTQIDTQLGSTLESLVHESGFFERGEETSAVSRGAADLKTYTITVEEGLRTHTIRVTDPITDMNLHRLVSHLRDMAHPSKQ